MSFSIEVDLKVCEGHGLCSQAAPEVYEVDDEGYVQLLPGALAEANRAKAERGALVCPVAALHVAD